MIKEFICRDYRMPIGEKTYIMGILNITPDSFVDGGRYNKLESAKAHAYKMVEEGADIIDVGGQSTRPGHVEISVEEELERILPIIEILAKEVNVPISVDTYRHEVAKASLEAGAHIINDIWGLQRDPKIADVAAEYGAGLIIMHNQTHNNYDEIISDMIRDIDKYKQLAIRAGLKEENIMIDPGIGAPYGKDVKQQYEILARLEELRILNVPILHAVSRKSFLGAITGREVEDRLAATIASVALGVQHGADFVRVHDIKEISDTVKVSDMIVRR